MSKAYGFLILLFLLPLSALGIATSNVQTSEAPPSNVGYALNLDYVYRYKTSSAVAVGTNWLLTARHVADDASSFSMTIAGTNYTEKFVVYHLAIMDSAHTENADLALVFFDKPLPGFYPLASSRSVGEEVLMIGYGYTGQVFQTYWVSSGTGQGVKRWGSNKISFLQPISYDLLGFDTTYDAFGMNFNLPDTLYEAGGLTYDSGGPVFAGRRDRGKTVWELAGIMTLVYGGETNQPAGTFAVDLLSYSGWIERILGNADEDMDELPDWWEAQYAGGSPTGMVAAADDDGDGASNLEEWIALTDPSDPAEYFRVLSLDASELRVPGSALREYAAEYNDVSLSDSAGWQQPDVWIPGTGPETAVPLTNAPAVYTNRFWRAKVRLP